MRKWLYGLLVTVVGVVVFFPVAHVNAGVLQDTSTPLPTVTITSPPAYNPSIATSPVYGNLNCPIGGVQNWGTITPSSAWSLLCSQCVVTPYVTSTPSIATSTPASICVTPEGGGLESCVTVTPVATGTATSTPTVIPTNSGSQIYCNPAVATVTQIATPTAVVSNNTIEDTSSLWVYSASWTGATCGVCSDNHQKNDNGSLGDIDNTAGVPFTGVGVTLYYAKYNNRGNFNVFIDGVFQITLDGYSSTYVLGSWASGALTNGVHTISVVSTGTKNSSSTGYVIILDKIIYISSVTNSNAVGVLSWLNGGVPSGFNGTYGKVTFSGDAINAGGNLPIYLKLEPHSKPIQLTYHAVVTNHELSAYCSNSADLDVMLNGSHIFWVDSDTGCDVTAFRDFYETKTVQTGSPGAELTFTFGSAADWPISGGTLDIVLEVWAYVECSQIISTNTPAPTSIPSESYCNSVSNVETGFSWSGLTVYPINPAACIDVGPYGGFDFGGLTSPPVGAFPWIAHLCFQDVSFGVAQIFGVSLYLDVVLYLLAVASLLRNLFVS